MTSTQPRGRAHVPPAGNLYNFDPLSPVIAPGPTAPGNDPEGPVFVLTGRDEVFTGTSGVTVATMLSDLTRAGIDTSTALAVGLTTTEESGHAVWVIHANSDDVERVRHIVATRTHTTPTPIMAIRSLLVPASRLSRLLARGVGLVRNEKTIAFDPATGQPLSWDVTGSRAITPTGRQVFPRLEPSVIGLVSTTTLGDHERQILLVKARTRDWYFSAVAGYIEHGESAEEAFVREVYEETGLVADCPRYVSSAPWPITGCFMIALTATTRDTTPLWSTDGEIIEHRWLTAKQIASGVVNLPRPGSLARELIDSFVAGSLDWE